MPAGNGTDMLQFHRRKQCLQKPPKAVAAQPENASGDAFSGDDGLLGYCIYLLSAMFSPLTNAGYKFETLSLLNQSWDATPRDEIEGREDLVVNNNAQYCSIVRTGIGSTRLVIGGEVDAGM